MATKLVPQKASHTYRYIPKHQYVSFHALGIYEYVIATSAGIKPIVRMDDFRLGSEFRACCCFHSVGALP